MALCTTLAFLVLGASAALQAQTTTKQVTKQQAVVSTTELTPARTSSTS
jgi:hypothetical protein